MSNSAARKLLFSASAFPIWIRLRNRRLGSGGLGICATMRAMSDEKASGTWSLRVADVSKSVSGARAQHSGRV